MDVSAFEAGVGEESPSLSEVVAFFDEDLRLPVRPIPLCCQHPVSPVSHQHAPSTTW